MKAIILAGGYGTRLGDLTKDTAKPLLLIAGKPLIEYVVEKISVLSDIDGLYIVTNDKFYQDFVDWSSQLPYSIHIINDGTTSTENRLGAIGDLCYVIDTCSIDDTVLIVGGDNLFEDSLEQFISYFKQNGTSIVAHDVKELEVARQLGIISIDQQSKILSFVEKPDCPSSTLASTLIYALQKDHIKYLHQAKELGFTDRAGDFIAYLITQEEVHAYVLQGGWFDVGTKKTLELVRHYIAQLHKQQ